VEKAFKFKTGDRFRFMAQQQRQAQASRFYCAPEAKNPVASVLWKFWFCVDFKRSIIRRQMALLY
jgi:hypothetical protein